MTPSKVLVLAFPLVDAVDVPLRASGGADDVVKAILDVGDSEAVCDGWADHMHSCIRPKPESNGDKDDLGGAVDHGGSLSRCVDNEGYPASLEVGKLYVSIPDAEAEKDGLIRVIDESGEDYLFPKARFRSADDLPQSVKKAVLAAAASASA